jgi:hypothetical protein
MKNHIHKTNEENGKDNELLVLNYLNKKEINWVAKKDKNAIIDFKHTKKNREAELKSRNFSSTDFPDWQIGTNKIEKMLFNIDTRYTVFFLFYDGLFKWDFKWHKLMTDCDYRQGGTTKRGRDERTHNVFIKRECLKKITNKIKTPETMDECLL